MGWFFNPAIATQLVPWSSGVFQMQRGCGPPQTLPLLYNFSFSSSSTLSSSAFLIRQFNLLFLSSITFRLVKFIIIFKTFGVYLD